MLMQLIIIQVVTFAAVVFVLRKLLYTETAKEARRLMILKSENSQKQKDLQEKINAASAAYSERIAKAEEYIRKIKLDTDEKLKTKSSEVLTKAKDEAEQIVKVALNKKDKLREEVVVEMEKKIPGIASRIVKQILSTSVKKIIHEELVKEALEQIKNLDKNKFDSKLKRAEVFFAYSLSKSQKLELSALLSKKVGRNLPLDEQEDGGLIAGFIVRLGTLVIDASLENRLKQMEYSLA